jgi:hypothetical protein
MSNILSRLPLIYIVSNLVYSFSIMRDLAKKKLKVPVEGTGYWFGWGREYEDVELKGKSIVMTQDDLTRSVESECQHLKRTIKANDLIDFIDLNFHLYERFPDEEINGHKGDALNAKSILYGLRAEEGELFEFDDEFDGEELVYAITINHTDKRVVIIFRGSVWGGSDWPTNLKVSMEKIDTPPVLVETNLEEDIMIHRGFKRKLCAAYLPSSGLPQVDLVVLYLTKCLYLAKNRVPHGDSHHMQFDEPPQQAPLHHG